MGRRQNGVRPRGDSIQMDFTYNGVRCRETLRTKPIKSALKQAELMRSSILHEIAMGTFNYAKHFPHSSKSRLFSHSTNLTVSAALDAFYSQKVSSCQFSTIRDYKSSIEHHLKPQFGDKYLNELTTSEIREWINTLTVSNKRINNILVPFRGMLANAYSDEIIDRNPIDRIRNLPNKTPEPEPFSPEEILLILDALPEQSKNLFQFAFYSGLRTSELIALEWKDIDWKANIINVRRASVRGQVKTPKTRSGERSVLILPPALEALESQRAYTHAAKGRVFHNPNTDSPWETDGQIRKTAWKPALERAGVRYRTPYQTRHTYASLLLTANENPMWVAQQMGHKDWGMIRKRYGRWMPDANPEAGNKISTLLSQISHKESVSV